MSTEKSTVKNSINGTLGTLLLSQESAKLKSPVYENSPVENSVNGTHGQCYSPRKGKKLKIPLSKAELPVQRVECYLPRERENRKYLSENWSKRYKGYNAIFLEKRKTEKPRELFSQNTENT